MTNKPVSTIGFSKTANQEDEAATSNKIGIAKQCIAQANDRIPPIF